MDSAEYHRRCTEDWKRQEVDRQASEWQLERFYNLMEKANGKGWRERNGVPRKPLIVRFWDWFSGR